MFNAFQHTKNQTARCYCIRASLPSLMKTLARMARMTQINNLGSFFRGAYGGAHGQPWRVWVKSITYIISAVFSYACGSHRKPSKVTQVIDLTHTRHTRHVISPYAPRKHVCKLLIIPIRAKKPHTRHGFLRPGVLS